MGHMAVPSRPNHVSGWLAKFDETLAELGIQADGHIDSRGDHPFRSPPKAIAFEAQLAEALKGISHRVYDSRAKGGALQVQLESHEPAAMASLQRLGVKPVNNQPLKFWRQ